MPGPLLWTIWKERNKRIFKNQKTSIEIIWKNLFHNIKETLALHQWMTEDFPTQPQKLSIRDNWNIQLPQAQLNSNRPHNATRPPSHWIHPPKKVIKHNFDGASKGNPGKVGFGGIFRNHEGRPLLLYFGSIGWDTNNSTELEGLWQGMQLADQHNFYPILIEGDTQILINMATLIQQ